MKSLWKSLRYRLEYFGCWLVAGLIPRLPRKACLGFARVLGSLHYRLDRKGRAVALDNLRAAFGEEISPRRREEIARASFQNFARAMLDLFWARNLTPANRGRYLVTEGFDRVRDLREKHGSVVPLSVHFGSYEWTSLAFAFEGMPLWIVAIDFKNPALEEIFRKAREHGGNRLIGQRHSMLRLLKALKREGGVGMLSDLGLHMHQPGVVIEEFGLKTHVTFLHALMHLRTGAPIVPVVGMPQPDGTCRITAHAPFEFPKDADARDVTQAVWNFYEKHIREQPELWLWNYRHWRYRPRDAQREYPPYAAESAKFERALRDARAA